MYIGDLTKDWPWMKLRGSHCEVMTLCPWQSLSEGVSGVLATRQHSIADPEPRNLKASPRGPPVAPGRNFPRTVPIWSRFTDYGPPSTRTILPPPGIDLRHLAPTDPHHFCPPPRACRPLPQGSMGTNILSCRQKVWISPYNPRVTDFSAAPFGNTGKIFQQISEVSAAGI